MSVNFDAKLSLDVSEFMRNLATAENAFQSLANKVQGTTLKISTEQGAVNNSAIAKRQQQASQELAYLEKKSRQQQLNAKTEAQIMQLEYKAQEARLKDHQTAGRWFDTAIAQRDAESKAFSNSLRAQMQEAAKADAAKKKAAEVSVRDLARQRYALYDVAAAYQQMAGVATTAIASVVGTAAEYERAFADVIRTTDFVSIKTGEAARVMRESLLNLSSEIPVAFGRITEIATIGNQLGIAQGDLENFTETVAKFASTTDVTIENAAMSFGRIGELLNVSDFNALGSAIAYAGVNAVATETQILATSKEIATTAKQAKFASPDVIGLATALASLGIAPEAARGSIIRSFAAINKAISEGGAELDKYAALSGMTAQQFAGTWQMNGAKAFDALLQGLQAASNDGKNLDTVLRDLGIKNVRDIQTLQKLGDNYAVYAQSIRDANTAFEEGTFLSEAYGVVQETVAAKIQVIQNQVQNMLASLGEASTGPVKGLLDVISGLLDKMSDLAKNPAIQAMATLTLVIGGLVVAIASVNSVVALSRAAMLAFATSMQAVKRDAEGMAVGLDKAKVAMAALRNVGWTLALTAGITALTAAISEIGDRIQQATSPLEYYQRKAEELIGSFGGLQDAITQDTAAVAENARIAGQSVEEYAKANNILLVHTDAVEGDSDAIARAKQVHGDLADILDEQVGSVNSVTGAVEAQTIAIGANTQEWIKNSLRGPIQKMLSENADLAGALEAGGFSFNDAMIAASQGKTEQYFGNIVNAYQGTLNKLKAINPFDWSKILGGAKTTQDINNLKNAFAGIFASVQLLGVGSQKIAENMKGVAAANQAVADSANNVASGAAKALRTVLDYASDLRGVFDRIRGIKFDRQAGLDAIASGWESIAKNGKDAAESIAEANAEIKDLTADKAILEYQLAVAERYGDEKRAAKLRAQLAKNDEKMTKATDKLTEAQESASKSLTDDTTAARENRTALTGLVGTYEDYIVKLVESGVKGKELRDKIKDLKDDFYNQGIQAGFAKDELDPYAETFDQFVEAATKIPSKVDIEFKSNVSAAKQAVDEYIGRLKASAGTYTASFKINYPDPKKLKPIVDAVTEKAMGNAFMWGGISAEKFYMGVYGVDLSKYATGGFVSGPGTATSDSIPAMLSNGEYVIQASAVKGYGLDFMNALNQQKIPMTSEFTASASAASNGVSIAQLAPEDRALLRAAIDRPINLYADSTKIAQTANSGNTLIARRGAR